MASEGKGLVRSVFGRLWWLLEGSRRVLLNLFWLALLCAVAFALYSRGPSRLEDKTVLVLDLKGRLVEQASGNVREIALKKARGEEMDQTVLRDLLAVLDAAAKDKKIDRVLLVLDDFGGGGMAGLGEAAAAIERFRASGKPVSAWGGGYDQRQYFLAAHADELLLHPMGMVAIEGFGRLRNYYRDALDRLGLSAHVIRVGKFKNAAEPFFANGPSPETLEADKALYDGLWADWTAAVEKARKVPAGSVVAGIEDIDKRLTAAGGDPAKLALNEKLVDGLKTRDEMRKLMIERGAATEDKKTFRQVSYADYLSRLRPKTDGDAVGVVVAEGEIVDGVAPPGTVGGRSTADLIHQARDDDKIKAIVLRVDSPGGSVFGSELVRRELELTRAAGKPVVVSMGDVAASGGYWISLASDEVIAAPATITGSIGVFAILPTGEGAMDKLSLHAAGYGTTWLASVYDPRKPLDPRFAALVQQAVDHIYSDFTGRVAVARKSTPEKIDAVAQGRVWTGRQALERGLVDRLGSFEDALKSAAQRGKLAEGYRVTYVEKEPGRLERALNLLSGSVAGELLEPLLHTAQAGAGLPAGLARQVQDDLGWLSDLTQGRRPYAAAVHCLCGEP